MNPSSRVRRVLLVVVAGLATVIALIVIAGCAPAPADRTARFRPVTQGSQAAVSDVRVVGAGPRVSFPWRPGRPELGVQIYWDDNPGDSAEMVRLKARRVVDYVVGLDANAICISFPFFTDSIRSNSVHAGTGTPSPERLEIFLAEAARVGLRMTLRPTLDEKVLVAANRLDWRGTIRPVSRDAWFASYSDFLTPYLAVAEKRGVATVVLGTELSSLESDRRWQDLVTRARTVFTGETGYAFNWDVFVHTTVRMPMDRIGVDAYPELPLNDDASVQDLAVAWDGWFNKRAAGPLPLVTLYEVGAAAQRGIYRHPANPHIDGTPVMEELQERWFAAACRTARNRALAGLFWWRVDFHNDPATADPLRDTHESFIGRAGEEAVRDCFADWGAAR